MLVAFRGLLAAHVASVTEARKLVLEAYTTNSKGICANVELFFCTLQAAILCVILTWTKRKSYERELVELDGGSAAHTL